jgi:hypothetical protein
MDKYLLMHFLSDTSSQPNGFFEEHVKPRVESWRQEMEGRGVLIDGAALDNEFATTVSNREPGAPVQDGPFAVTEERLAGIDLTGVSYRGGCVRGEGEWQQCGLPVSGGA